MKLSRKLLSGQQPTNGAQNSVDYNVAAMWRRGRQQKMTRVHGYYDSRLTGVVAE